MTDILKSVAFIVVVIAMALVFFWRVDYYREDSCNKTCAPNEAHVRTYYKWASSDCYCKIKNRWEINLTN